MESELGTSSSSARSGISPNTCSAPPPTHHFVLVHGVGHGSWCWYKIRTLLESSGHCRVSCVDLASAGVDRTDANTLESFQEYNKPLLDLMASLPENEQVVVVGHSAGGLSVTEASHKFPSKIRVAVYLAATMLKLGFCTDRDVLDAVPDLSRYGENVNELEFAKGPNNPPTSTKVATHLLREILYNTSPPEDCTLAAMLLKPGPLIALQSARFDDDYADDLAAAEGVERVYIKTMQDNVVKPEQQDAMINRWPPSRVYALDCDHSPFFSSPFLLTGLLLNIAAAAPAAARAT
ncbi:unnamed protein product [Linum tenue]|uniref:AB hydrolase-1 domain-containing protein n=1 Tax=Linum tenue TaxID=586396 RepID=A0AAV0R432_9ROSI|nr:unnamed protein product [Linum tenue]